MAGGTDWVQDAEERDRGGEEPRGGPDPGRDQRALRERPAVAALEAIEVHPGRFGLALGSGEEAMSEKACPNCGKRFTPWRSKQFCSERCRKQAENRRLRGDETASGAMIPDADKSQKKDQQNQEPRS